MISFVIFDASSIGQAFDYIKEMFGVGVAPLISKEAIYYLRSYAVVFLTAIIAATPFPKKLISKIEAVSYLEPIILIIILVAVTSYLIDVSFNPFLYFRF